MPAVASTTTTSIRERLTPATVADLEFTAGEADINRMAEVFLEQGAMMVRGLMNRHVDAVRRDIMQTTDEAIAQLDRATRSDVGWHTPNGSLFIPSPAGYVRQQQIMVTGTNYKTSAALLQSALEPALLDIVEAILGPNIETFNLGQCLVKEPAGGHPKHLHQDSAYFEHRYLGPVGVLVYCVDTNVERGALHVVPGTHKLGQLDHVDTFSHLGLDDGEWPWEAALPLEGHAGDAIFFQVRTVHGSKPNFTDMPRPVFIHRYRRPDDYIVAGGTTVENRSARGEHDASQEQGLMVRGFRSQPG